MYINENKVALLLSTYNGERYIKEQLQSLRNQSYKDFTLYVRDDGSSDKTIEILKQHNDLNIVLVNDSNNLGPAKSFLTLLKLIESDYYFFLDQDDVWERDKIEVAISKISNHDGPVLYHSDLTLVDSSLRIIEPSFDKHLGLEYPKAHKLNYLLLNNCFVGCTMAFNQALKNRTYLDDINNIRMHDWWIGLTAISINAKVIKDSRKTILYRQHCNNVTGITKKKAITTYFSKDFVIKKFSYFQLLMNQQQKFAKVMDCELTPDQVKLFDLFSNPNILSLVKIIRFGLGFRQVKSNILFYIWFMLFYRF